MNANSALSILIPVRAQSIEYFHDRLRLRDQYDLTDIETVITDDGSPDLIGQELRRFCEDRGWRYRRLETGHLPFSLARARNAGLAAAEAEWVFFDDLDMVYATHFFQKLRNEIALVVNTPFQFLSLPAVYLKEEPSKKILNAGKIDQFVPTLLTRLALEDPHGSSTNSTVESFAPASAILAMKKDTAEKVGGYDETFTGWGGEDRDFVFRLLIANGKLPKPTDFSATRTWNLNDTREFAGWRALFRLHGDYLARKGIYAFHLFHESNPWRSEAGRSNIERAARKALSIVDGYADQSNETPEHQAFRHSLLYSVYSDPDYSSVQSSKRFASDRSGTAKFAARMRKLWQDPYAFFRDSRLPALRSLRLFFVERQNEAKRK